VTSENGKKGAHPLGMVLATYHRLSAHLETVWHSKVSPDSRLDPEIALHLAGSARRGLPTCGDLDAVLLVPDDHRAYDPLSPSMWPADVLGVEAMRVAGEGQGVVLRFAGGLTADVRVVRRPDDFGGALAFLTGPRRFNRLMAYNLFGEAERAPEIAEIADTERGVLLDALGCWVPPSERESYAAQNGF
jgi:DNA polymerase/3'-5' exonuclease PolX